MTVTRRGFLGTLIAGFTLPRLPWSARSVAPLSGIDTGTHIYTVTFVTDDGAEVLPPFVQLAGDWAAKRLERDLQLGAGVE